MGPLSRDDAVRMALGLAPSTLRALIADGARAGIATPFAGAERLRRWRELRRAELTHCGAVVVLRAWGKEWHMTPYRLIEHVQRVGRRTVRPDEIDAIATRGLQWGG